MFKKLCLTLLCFGTLFNTIEAEGRQASLPSTDVDVTLDSQMVYPPEIDEDLDEDHDSLLPEEIPDPNYVYFFLTPRQFRFDLPAFALFDFASEESRKRPYLLGIADFRASEEAWILSFEIQSEDFHEHPLFEKIKAITWQNTAYTFYGKTEEDRPIVSDDHKFLETGIEVRSVYYPLEHFGEAMKVGQSTEALYGYYGIEMDSIHLAMQSYRQNADYKEGHFKIEWILSNDLQIVPK